MKHLFVFAAVFAALTLGAGEQKAEVTAGVLNVRVKPSAKSDTILQLKRGDEVIVVEKGAEWTAIRPPANASFYVSSPLIADGKMKTNGNMRAGSGVNFQSLCILPAGTPVKVLDEKNSWSRIAVPAVDVRCYVASQYVKLIPVAAPAADNKKTDTPAVQPVIKKGDIVSFNSASIKKISKDYVKGTEKNITVSGTLAEISSKEHGTTFVISVDERYYHLAGVIPAAIDRSKTVEVKGISRMVRSWKVPIIEIEKITQK